MDKIEICNMALSRIGASPIEALTEASEAARKCNQFYEHDRRVVLRRYPWPWATRRVELAAMTDSPQDYLYAYRYPADCCYLRKIFAVAPDGHFVPLPDVRYKIVSDETGLVIYTNEPRVVAEYTADVRDAALFDEMFCEALSWKLAASIALKLTGNEQIISMARSEYDLIFNMAVSDAENEQNVPLPPPSSFIRARFETVL